MNVIKKFFCWLLNLVTREEYEILKNENNDLLATIEELEKENKELAKRLSEYEHPEKVTLTLVPNDEIDFYINDEPAGDKTSFTFNKYEEVNIYAKAKDPNNQDYIQLYVDGMKIEDYIKNQNINKNNLE